MRCVVDQDGKWLCGTPEQVPLSLAAPAPAKPVATPPAPSQRIVERPIATAPVTTEKTAIPTATPATETTLQPAPIKQTAITAPSPQPTRTKTVAVSHTHCPMPAADKQAPTALISREDAALSIDAEELEIQGKNIFLYKNKVVMERADQSLKADLAKYNHDLGLFEAEGNVQYRETGTVLEGERARFNTQTERGTIDNAHYRILETGASGDAAQIEMVSRYVNRYHNTTYTTCPTEQKSWELSAAEVELDELEGWGSAKNAVVSFKGVPILYAPTYTFPLDARRKSGLLSPSWGYSKTGGGDVSAPYYLNLAPNRDATVTPRIIGKRGISLSGNLRYLNSNNQGVVDASFLPSDDLTGDDRYQFKLDHQGTLRTTELANQISYQIDFATLSDKQYLSDFGNSLGLASTDTLEQRATLSYQQDRLKLSAEITDYYTLDEILSAANEPYRKLPQIDASWSNESRDNQLHYSVEGQFVHFDHSDASKSSAERYWIKPSASYNLTLLNDSAYLKPTVTLSQSYYSLDSGSSSSMSIPHYTLESGLFLERDGGSYLQTLEPSAKLSYIPEGKDSGHTFETNSDSSSDFYGKDSAPHTKQLTLAIASDFLRNQDGSKLVTTSLERSRDFRSDRTQDWNDLIGKVGAHYGAHNATIKLHLDDPNSSYRSWSNTLHADYQYDNEAGQLFNIGYIHERGSKKQIDLSTAWEINSQWDIFARYNQELISGNNHRLEDLIGVSYDSCCWSARFSRRNYFTGTSDDTNQYDTGWFLVLELKGLGKLGKSSSLNTLLEQSIKGYKEQP